MADVNINKYRASVIRSGSTPATPGYVASEGQNPVDPSGSAQNHLPVTINPMATGLSITDSQILSGAGTVGQYIRGDGSLADFPSSSGGGSSVSYYLNGSISQGTIGGVAYKELNKVPILGTGTDFSINANGYIASFITDAGDPNKLEIPAGNWNFETYFSASSSGGSPSFYIELYKYDGSTFTLIASSSSNPELIAFGTTVNAYFSTLTVPPTNLALTDRLAIRIYVTHSGRTITLHTEDNNLCQVITTFTTGLTALNNLTSQVQFFAVGTSGSDFNIASSVDTHTFNLPTASASNRGALSSADWSTFNNKENAITAGTTAQYFRGDKTFQTLNTSVVPEGTNLYYTEARVNANTNVAANTAARHNAVTLGTANGLSLSTQVLSLGLASAGVTGALSGTDWSTFNSKQNALTLTTTGTSGAATLVGSTLNIPQYQAAGTYVTAVTASSPLASSGGTTPNITIQQASGSQSGFLSSTDWTTFNNKQNALTNPVTGTGTTNYLPKFTGTSTIGNSNLINDSSGNLGLGVTPSSWAVGQRAFDFGTIGSIETDGDAVAMSNNRYFDGGANRYKISDFASIFVQVNGQHIWYNAPSGTAGNAISFTQAMTLTSGGNLLVGTTTDAGYKLDVNGTGRFSGALTGTSASFGDIVTNTSGGYRTSVQQGYILRNDANSVNLGGITRRSFWAGGTALDTQIFAETGYSIFLNPGGSASIGLTLASTGAATFSSSVTAGGQVSVNAGNGNQLYLNNSGQQYTQLTFANNSSSTKGALWWDNNNSLFEMYAASGGGLTFYTNATERMRITSGGNVGIGTSSPSYKLQIRNDVAASTSLEPISLGLYNNSDGGAAIYFQNAVGGQSKISFGVESTGAGTDDSYLGFSTGANTSLTERMRITAGGNVGIGTTTPQSLLSLGSGVNAQKLLLYDANNNFKYGFGIQNDELRQFYPSNGRLVFGTVSTSDGSTFTERMRITSGGNVGIGVVPSAWDTGNTVKAVEISQGAFWGYGTTNVYLASNYYWSGSNRIYLKSAAAAEYSITNGSHQWFNAPSGTAGNAISFTQAMTLTSGGNLLVGTTTDAGFKLDVNGTGRITGVLTTNSGTNSTNGIQIISSLSSSLFTGGIEFIRTTVAGGSKVQPLRDAAIGGVGLSFLVTANNTAEVNATYTSAMNILNNGNVGIGTATPNDKFHVVGGIYSTSLTTPTNTNIGAIQIGYDGTNGVIRTWNYSPLIISNYNYQSFETNGSERMRITSGGNVGIGTSSPQAILDVSHSAGTTNIIRVSNGPGNYRWRVDQNFSMIMTNASNVDTFSVNTTGSTTGRNFGISNGGFRGGLYAYVDVLGGGSDNSLTLFSEGGANQGNIYFSSGGSATRQMTITSGGNVLIGTTTDSGDKLRVNGNTFTNTIMTYNPENDNRSGVAWRLGAASIGAVTPNRRLRVNVGGVEYYIGAVEV